ncbi:MAG: hypoxanthine phosphoribosyltransferase [Bacteroidales bacterium]|jgi:hypoxanthine phosphoribosyltransferase|nr:hypoxanthine phosphoribosyltransferase [Bacteroidales bacterium]
MLEKITINDKIFCKYIDKQEIQQMVKSISMEIEKDFVNEEIYFIAILNGAFVFAADLIREIRNRSKIYFIKISSYEGMSSKGSVDYELKLNVNLENKNVIVLEDIIETGLTIDFLIKEIKEMNPRRLEIATLLYKPQIFKGNYNIKYIGKTISQEFIVGYGMDYEQKGRELENIYILESY